MPLAIVDANKKRCASRACATQDPLTSSASSRTLPERRASAATPPPSNTMHQGCSSAAQQAQADGGRLDKEPEIVDESDGDDDAEDAYDVLESALCGETAAAATMSI